MTKVVGNTLTPGVGFSAHFTSPKTTGSLQAQAGHEGLDHLAAALVHAEGYGADPTVGVFLGKAVQLGQGPLTRDRTKWRRNPQ